MKINRREFNLGLLGTVGTLAIHPCKAQPQLRVKGARLIEHLNGTVGRIQAWPSAPDVLLYTLLKLDRNLNYSSKWTSVV